MSKFGMKTGHRSSGDSAKLEYFKKKRFSLLRSAEITRSTSTPTKKHEPRIERQEEELHNGIKIDFL